MSLKLKTKQDRQLWQFLTPNQRVFAKTGTCINLTADFLPEDIPTRFVFVQIDKMIYQYIMKGGIELDWKVAFEGYIKLYFEDEKFKAIQQPTKHLFFPFNLPSAIIRTRDYSELPVKYQKLVLSKVDISFEHVSKFIIC